MFEQLEELVKHPVVRAAAPHHQIDWLKRTWENRHKHYEFLESMPQVFSHLDAFPRNIFVRDDNGREEIVLVDWAFAGLAAPGEELAALCIASACFSPTLVPLLSDIERLAFAGYVAGLRETGWDGDEALIWRAYRGTAELRYGPGWARLLIPALMNDELRAMIASDLGLPPDSLVGHVSSLTQWIMDSSTSSSFP